MKSCKPDKIKIALVEKLKNEMPLLFEFNLFGFDLSQWVIDSFLILHSFKIPWLPRLIPSSGRDGRSFCLFFVQQMLNHASSMVLSVLFDVCLSTSSESTRSNLGRDYGYFWFFNFLGDLSTISRNRPRLRSVFIQQGLRWRNTHSHFLTAFFFH